MRPTLSEGSEGRQRVGPEVWRSRIDFTCEISSVSSTLTAAPVVWSRDRCLSAHVVLQGVRVGGSGLAPGDAGLRPCVCAYFFTLSLSDGGSADVVWRPLAARSFFVSAQVC